MGSSPTTGMGGMGVRRKQSMGSEITRHSRFEGRPLGAIAPTGVLYILALVAAVVLANVMLLAGPSEAQQTTPVSFGKSLLNNASSVNPTSLQIGPDGRLYVAQQDSTIKAYTEQHIGPNVNSDTNTETIDLIKSMPNRNDDGSLNS